MPVAVRPLPPELEEKARAELFEDPKKLEDGIQHLKEWIAKQPHLNARTDDQWLATFLRGCKFSLERTKEKIDLYYSMRVLAADLKTVTHRDPKFMEILKLGVVLILPKTDKVTDPRVLIWRGGAISPGKYSMLDIMSVANVLQRICLVDDDQFVVNGNIAVMDMKGTSIAHFSGLTPVLMKKMVVVSQEAVPMRMKGAHYFHMYPAFEVIFNLFKTFLNDKNRNRIYVHGKDIESLQKYVPKDTLPVEYGGNGEYWANKVEEYSDWLDEDEQYRTEESKRPGKPKTAEDMFGVEGSFRQLQFD